MVAAPHSLPRLSLGYARCGIRQFFRCPEKLAERQGFEPWRPLRTYTPSKRADSTALTPLRVTIYYVKTDDKSKDWLFCLADYLVFAACHFLFHQPASHKEIPYAAPDLPREEPVVPDQIDDPKPG